MKSDNQNIIELIDNVRGTLVKRRFVFTALTALAAGAVILILAGLTVKSSSLREDQYFSLFMFFLIFPIAGIIYSIFKYLTSRVSRQDIAVQVEEARPELMDAYACAVDIAEKGGPAGPIEEALTRQVKSKFQSGEISGIIIPNYLSVPVIAVLLIVTLLLSWGAVGSPITKTAFLHVKAKNNPVLAGVDVQPGDVSLPHGKDLRVEAKVKRGRESAILKYNMGGKWISLDMYNEGEGNFSAVVYGVDSDFEYKVETPDVSSSEYSVNVYLEPQIEKISVKVTPPEYMGRKPFTNSEIKDLVIPENSIVDIEITANKDVKAVLVEDKAEIPFGTDTGKIHKYSLRAESTHIYSFILNDNDGYSSTSKQFKVSIVKDMPPHVEVTKPAKDIKKYKSDVVQLEVNALDDFGLEEVNLHIEFSTDVNGRFLNNSRVEKILKGQAEKVLEKTLFYNLNLKDEAAKVGDIITYYFSATDNKQPTPQTSRSKIYFIEIRPDKSDIQENEEEQDGDQQEQQLTVNDLIALQKDLIRKLIDVRTISKKLDDEGKYKVTDENRQQLSSDTATLKLAVQKRYDKLNEEAKKMQADLGVIGDYFEGSVKALKEAEIALNNDLLDKGMRFQNQSLHNLIKIAIELEKNSQKQKSKSKNQQQQQEQPPEEEEKDDERLADMLEKLEEIEEKQEDLNKEMRDEKNKEELAQQELQKQMKEQQKEMEELAEQLEEMQQQQASQQMQQAAQQQQQANQQQQQGNSEGAEQQAQQAQQSIENAKNEVKRAMRDKARQKLQQLARQLDKTVEKQNQINEKTSGVDDPKSDKGKAELADLKKKQDEVQKEIQDVMDQLGAAANELDEKYPEVAEALRESREFASNQGIQRRLKRSSNALHYKRKDAAEREQEKAADAMNLLGHKVRDAINRLPQATLEELLKMRQDLEMVRREVANNQRMGAQQSSQRSNQISQMLQDMGERLKNDDLQTGLPQYLKDAAKSGDAGTIGTSQMKAVNQAAFILETLINQADLEKRLTLNKRTGAPPDKYRRSVREYLKSLSVQEK